MLQIPTAEEAWEKQRLSYKNLEKKVSDEINRIQSTSQERECIIDGILPLTMKLDLKFLGYEARKVKHADKTRITW